MLSGAHFLDLGCQGRWFTSLPRVRYAPCAKTLWGVQTQFSKKSWKVLTNLYLSIYCGFSHICLINFYKLVIKFWEYMYKTLVLGIQHWLPRYIKQISHLESAMQNLMCLTFFLGTPLISLRSIYLSRLTQYSLLFIVHLGTKCLFLVLQVFFYDSL